MSLVPSSPSGRRKEGRGYCVRPAQVKSSEKFPKPMLITTAQIKAKELEEERLVKQGKFRKPPPPGREPENCVCANSHALSTYHVDML